jgi:hypothetical protein
MFEAMVWKSAVASFTPTMLGTSAPSIRSVSASIVVAVRPGMLYRRTGSVVASAIFVKWATSPAWGGLL